MLLPILYDLWKIKAVRVVLFCLIGLAAVGGIFGYLSHKIKVAEREANQSRTNANQANQKAEGLGIYVNAQPMAANIELEKQYANQQAINSNVSGNNFNISVQRDSSEFSNDYRRSKTRYCREFANDSKCR